MTEDDTDAVKAKLRRKRDKPKPISPQKLVSSGSTLLDLACTNSTRGAFPKGSYIFFVGDSDSGKTWLTMNCLAEAAINPRFDDYRFIYDPAEGGAQMDIEYYFGEAVADRLEAPDYNEEGDAKPSGYVEDFYINLDRALDGDEPCIYILDSMDALNPREADARFDADAKAIGEGKDTAGTFGTAKAKLNSNNIRRIIPKLRATGSILIIISQTRDNIGFGAQYNPKTRGGGRALKFYADIEIWTSVKGAIAKTVRGKKRSVGNMALCKVKRSRVTGRKADVIIPIYHEHGVDDIGSMVEYLVEEKHWTKSAKGGKIKATDFEIEGSLDMIVGRIENEGLERQLKQIVGDVWKEIIEASKVKRKRRYE